MLPKCPNPKINLLIQIWKQYGFLPEFYNVAQGGAANKREGYPLRPELIEYVMYLYRATRDPFLLTVGEDMLQSIQVSERTGLNVDCFIALAFLFI